ncbi:MAG: autotransporter-associated beta strand repeat-containing protein [Kiritimatiellia bacterium]
MRGFTACFSASAVLVAFAASVQAADYTWGGGTGNWSDANWNPGPVSGPTAGSDTATINTGTVSLNVGGMNVGSLTLGTGGTFNAYNWNGVNTYTGYGNLLLQGGVINGIGNYHNWGAGILVNTTVSGSSASTLSASSFFNLNGTGAGSSVFTVADVTGDANPDLHVTATLNDVSADNSWVAAALVKEGPGTMRLTSANLYTGGTTVNQGVLLLDGGSGGYARIKEALTVNSGASVTFANDDGTGLGWQGFYKVTALTINGGTVSSDGVMHVWDFAGGLNMTGGTLQSNHGVSDAGGPQLEWNKVDVTTHASADTATIGGRIRLRADGGYTGLSFNVADGAAAADLLVSAAVTEASGGLGLVKSGAGTLVLSGANSYSGATTINDGTLLVNGHHTGGGLITLSATATFGGGGQAGDVDVWTAGTLAPGDLERSDNWLQVGALSLGDPGAQLNFELGAPDDGAAPLAVNDLVLAASLPYLRGIVNVIPQTGFASAPAGSKWRLIDLTAGTVPAGSELTLAPALAGGYSLQAAEGDTAVYLVAVPEAGTAGLVGLALLILRRLRRAGSIVLEKGSIP